MFYLHKIIPEYSSEIISRSRTIKTKCSKLLSKDFATETPKSLAITIKKICSFIEKAIKSDYKSIKWKTIKDTDCVNIFKLLQDMDQFVCDLSADLRYIEGAQTFRLPWSIVKPFEDYVKSLLGKIETMLQPQWEYNYSIIITDIRKDYENVLTGFEDLVSEGSLDDVFSNFKNPFFILSFPSIERKNVLLHCLLGHEIGHLIFEEFLTSKLRKEFQRKAQKKIKEYVEEEAKKIQNPGIDPKLLKEFRSQYQHLRATRAWERGLDELFSDIVGSLLFGPAILFSMFEIAIQTEMDRKPNESNNFYPPWRFRLREILKVIQTTNPPFFPLTKQFFESETCRKVNERFKLIKGETRKRTDKQILEGDEILSFTYRQILGNLVDVRKFIKKRFKTAIIEPKVLYKKLRHLIERIDYGIPPNSYEISIKNHKSATLVEIINAAWFHKISWKENIFDKKGDFNEEIYIKRDRMNRLTLKAIEYADIESDFERWKKSKNKNSGS